MTAQFSLLTYMFNEIHFFTNVWLTIVLPFKLWTFETSHWWKTIVSAEYDLNISDWFNQYKQLIIGLTLTTTVTNTFI